MSQETKVLVGVIAGICFIALISLVVWFLQPGPAIFVQAGPLPGRLGAMVTVVGERFPANQEIYVGLASPGMPPTAGTSFVTAVADRDGKFTVAFPYPTDPTWAKLSEVTVYAGTPGGDAVGTARLPLNSVAWLLSTSTATAAPPTFTLTPAATASSTPTGAPVPAISLLPVSGRVGVMVTVTGRGWRPGEQLSLILPGLTPQSARTVGAANTDTQGNFTGYFVFPADWTGPAVTTVLARNSNGSLQASAVFQVLGLATPTVPSPTPLVVKNWLGEYYNNPSLLGNPVVSRDDSGIDFNWGSAAPAAGLPNQFFSVRWTRTMYFVPGSYRFLANVDDGVRIWFDDKKIIDEWHAATGQEYHADVYDVADGMHTLRVEFYQDIGPARVHVWWQQVPKPTSTPTKTATPTHTAMPTKTATATATATMTATTVISGTIKP